MNLYCKVYLDSSLPKNAVVKSLAEWTGGQIHLRTVSTGPFEVDVVTNEDFDEARGREGRDGFLFYRYYLDIEPQPDVSEAEYVGAIRGLLTRLQGEGLRAVASCDFEHLLHESP